MKYFALALFFIQLNFYASARIEHSNKANCTGIMTNFLIESSGNSADLSKTTYEKFMDLFKSAGIDGKILDLFDREEALKTGFTLFDWGNFFESIISTSKDDLNENLQEFLRNDQEVTELEARMQLEVISAINKERLLRLKERQKEIQEHLKVIFESSDNSTNHDKTDSSSYFF